ncbi:hypothetical protein MVEN_00442500 [Mycena venus]|uniref:Uncharacterized protein n=1 Tax=Mycena venus TaxID=2733690 RepID=A0A8H6YR26_9AGAR|nr:hypothetical protein MVEN_00442500 [Mycena venus]
MSATPSKDLHSIIGIYKAPAGVSRKEFDAHMQRLMAPLALVPVVKKLRDLNVIYQNDEMTESIQGLGMPPAPATVMVTASSENRDDMVEYVQDPEVVRLIHGAENFGLQAGACAFTADLTVEINKPTAKARKHGIFIFKIPAHLSEEQYHKKIDAMTNDFLAVPVAQKHLVKYSKWVKNDSFVDELKRWKYPDAERVVVLMLEWDDLDSMKEVLTHEQIQKVIAGAKEDLGLHIDSNCFSADVVNLI